jgi:predicted RNA binding protein YcfA (HicA-like mRNA interferase family)
MCIRRRGEATPCGVTYISPKSRLPLGKLRVLSGKDACAVLAQHGFVEVRKRRSHIVMQKKVPEGTVTVPIPDHKEIRIGTLQSIIRRSGP